VGKKKKGKPGGEGSKTKPSKRGEGVKGRKEGPSCAKKHRGSPERAACRHGSKVTCADLIPEKKSIF